MVDHMELHREVVAVDLVALERPAIGELVFVTVLVARVGFGGALLAGFCFRTKDM